MKNQDRIDRGFRQIEFGLAAIAVLLVLKAVLIVLIALGVG